MIVDEIYRATPFVYSRISARSGLKNLDTVRPLIRVTIFFLLLQFTSSKHSQPYVEPDSKARLHKIYLYLQSKLHSTSRPLKLVYYSGSKENVVAWVSLERNLAIEVLNWITLTTVIIETSVEWRVKSRKFCCP